MLCYRLTNNNKLFEKWKLKYNYKVRGCWMFGEIVVESLGSLAHHNGLLTLADF